VVLHYSNPDQNSRFSSTESGIKETSDIEKEAAPQGRDRIERLERI